MQRRDRNTAVPMLGMFLDVVDVADAAGTTSAAGIAGLMLASARAVWKAPLV